MIAYSLFDFLSSQECAGFGGHGDGCAGQELLDGEDLQAGVLFLPELGVVDAGRGCFFGHFFSGRFEGDEDADFGFFAGDDADQVADGGAVDVARFDLDEDAFEFGVVGVDVVDDAVYAFIGAFFAFACVVVAQGFGADEGEGPPLELVAVAEGEVFGAAQVGWLAFDGKLDTWIHLLHTAFDEGDGQECNVYADPGAAQLFGCCDGCATATKWIQDDVAGVGAGLDDALQEGQRFLGGIAELFC